MALVTTAEELKQYLEVSAATKVENISPSLRIAERRSLIPLIGQEFYDELSAAYETAAFKVAIMPDTLKPVVKLAQEALANIAMMLVLPRLAVQVSDAGIRRPESDSMKSAYQYQQLDLIESYGRAGFDALEDLLGFLDRNIADYPIYAESSAYADQQKYFIRSAIEFSDFYHIGQARLTFVSIRYIMKRIEDGQLRPMLGDTFFTALKLAQQTGLVNNPLGLLLQNYVQPAIALLTIAKALIERKVDVTSQGVTVSILGTTNNVAQKNTAPMGDVNAMVAQLTADGNDFLRRLLVELAANPGLYPGYVATAVEQTGIQITNKKENKYFAV